MFYNSFASSGWWVQSSTVMLWGDRNVHVGVHTHVYVLRVEWVYCGYMCMNKLYCLFFDLMRLLHEHVGVHTHVYVLRVE